MPTQVLEYLSTSFRGFNESIGYLMKIVARHFLTTDADQAIFPFSPAGYSRALMTFDSTESLFFLNPCRNLEMLRLASVCCGTCLQENYSAFLLAPNLIEGSIAADSSSSALDSMIIVDVAKDINAHTSLPGMQFILIV